MLASPHDRDRFRVLIGHRPPAPATRYVDQVVEVGHGGIDFEFFGGLLKRTDIDVVHVLNPRQVLGPHKTRAQRRAQALELEKTLAGHRIALVQTIFGPEQDPTDESLQILNRNTSAFIALDEVTPTPDPGRTTVIPHAHYRDRFLGFPVSRPEPGRIACVSRDGLARAAEGPLKVFSLLDTPDVSLRVVGGIDPELDELVPRAIRRSPDTVSTRIEHLSDAELVREITAAEIVITPALETLADMTTVFMALSLDRPVLVPLGPTATAVAQSVGTDWVHLLRGPVTAELLDDAIQAVRTTPRRPRPRLGSRDIDVVARQYEEVFRKAAR